MKRDRLTYIKNILFPCVVFSAVTGGLTGGMIFLFRKAASLVGEWSAEVYHYAAGHPYAIPLVILGAAAGLGGIAAVDLRHEAQVLPHRQVFGHRRILRRDAHHSLHLRRVGSTIRAADGAAALRGGRQAGEHADGGRLSNHRHDDGLY